MPDVVGVVFHSGGKIYYFDPGAVDLSRGDRVVVQTMRGTEIGEVVEAPYEVPQEEIPAPLKRVVRKASPLDLEAMEANESLRREALATCRQLIAQHGLEMKLVDAELAFGGGKIVFSFYAEDRIDFRALVADLARTLKMRIELRQIGAREEARLVGGLGPCGRHLCCRSFNVGQDPVSIRMAKEQNLPLNPMKISGLCGRLMCCLKYEQEQYVCFRKAAPKCGTQIETSQGAATVVAYKVPKEALTVRYPDGTYADISMDECSCGGQPCGSPETTCDAPDAAASSPGTAASEAAPDPSVTPPGPTLPSVSGNGGEAAAEAPALANQPVEGLTSGPATGCETEEGFEILVSCDAPVWTPELTPPADTDLTTVEDSSAEPPLGEAEVLADFDPGESVTAGAGTPPRGEGMAAAGAESDLTAAGTSGGVRSAAGDPQAASNFSPEDEFSPTGSLAGRETPASISEEELPALGEDPGTPDPEVLSREPDGTEGAPPSEQPNHGGQRRGGRRRRKRRPRSAGGGHGGAPSS